MDLVQPSANQIFLPGMTGICTGLEKVTFFCKSYSCLYNFTLTQPTVNANVKIHKEVY